MAGASSQTRARKVQIVRGSSLDIPLAAFDVEVDATGVEISREPIDLTGAELCWILSDCDGQEAAVKTSAAGGIEVLDQLDPNTIGQAIVHLLASDLDLPPGDYLHEAWLNLLDGRRGALIPSSPFCILPAEKLPGAAASQPDGDPASQTQAARSFSFAWPSLSGTAAVGIPGTGMLRDTYFVGYEFEGSPSLVGLLAFDNKTATGFDAVVQGGGALLPGTIINFHTRDQA